MGIVLHPPSVRYVEPSVALKLVEGCSRPDRVVAVYALEPGPEASDFAHIQSWDDPIDHMSWWAIVRADMSDLLAERKRPITEATYCLLDAPGAAFGGTGHAHDWEQARALIQNIDVPTFLAGGLAAANVGEAVQFVRPVGVDVSSGIESSPGNKDRRRIVEFIDAVRAADGRGSDQ